jgi:hypothetical protein
MFKKTSAVMLSLLLAFAIGGVANAAPLDLGARLSVVSTDNISASQVNQTLANQVYDTIANASSQDAASEALSDHDLGVFKFYYYPANVTTTSSTQPILAKSPALLLGLAAASSCYNQSSINDVVSKAGTSIVQVVQNGKWCVSGGAVVSSTVTAGYYVMGGTAGWRWVNGANSYSAYTSSQARMLTMVTLEMNLVYPINQYTFCTKLYGNTTGSYSSSQSCAL